MEKILTKAAIQAQCSDMDALADAMESAFSGNRPVIDEILDANIVDEDRFLEGVSEGLNLEWIPDLRIDSDDRLSLQAACSAGVAVNHRFLPFSYVRGAHHASGGGNGGSANFPSEDELPLKPEKIKLVSYDPVNLTGRQAAAMHIGLPVRWCMTSRTKLLESIQTFYGVGADTFEELLKGRDVDLNDLEIADEANILDADDDEEASVMKYVNQIIRDALSQRATDIHLEPMKDSLQIRYRIDGILAEVAVPENIRTLQASLISRLKVMAHLDIAEKRLPQDGRINLTLDGQSIDVRVATIPSVEGESISLRLLGQENFTLDRLGLLPRIREIVDELLQIPNGIVLVTGPTGSGKSTTLYTFLSSLNAKSQRIVTIEDPVEHKLDGVVQIAVKPEIDLTFASGLRSILRGDPNVIMVGEIRDLETAEIAIRSALTGHLVFSTLHTNDALGGISRLSDMGVEPYLVSASVRAFIAQRLVRRLCEECKVPVMYSDDYLRSVGFPVGELNDFQIFSTNEKGCDKCRGIGFHGRMAIYEVALLKQELQDLVASGATMKEVRAQALRDGFIPMRAYGWEKVMAGETTLEEVVSVTSGD